jgi:predicted DNA-binding transcriptional regulator YafY
MESYALGKLNFEDIKNFASISGIKSLYPILNNGFISDILNVKINSAYLVKNQGFENISHQQECFDKVSAAIVKLSPIEFVYKEKHRIVYPYKLVNNEGVWYLFAEEDEKLKSFTFSKIKQFSWSNESNVFIPKKEFLDIISQNDTNWFSSTFIEVVLEVDNVAKEYFFRKDILPNKQILEQKDNSFTISTKVSYDDEILKVVKYWMPYIKIVSPLYLKEKFNNILKDYLKTTQPRNEKCNTS